MRLCKLLQMKKGRSSGNFLTKIQHYSIDNKNEWCMYKCVIKRRPFLTHFQASSVSSSYCQACCFTRRCISFTAEGQARCSELSSARACKFRSKAVTFIQPFHGLSMR